MLSWPKSLCGFSHKMLGKELNEIFGQPKSIHLRDYTDSERFLKSLLGSKEKHFILKKITKEYNQFWEWEVPCEGHEKYSKLYQTVVRDP